MFLVKYSECGKYTSWIKYDSELLMSMNILSYIDLYVSECNFFKEFTILSMCQDALNHSAATVLLYEHLCFAVAYTSGLTRSQCSYCKNSTLNQSAWTSNSRWCVKGPYCFIISCFNWKHSYWFWTISAMGSTGLLSLKPLERGSMCQTRGSS